jgi:NAD(P)-dependent dehydrogenase (short-subunit alcohol dehydrogenase family)
MRTIADMSTLSGRAAVVTGGGGHIGWAVAETLAELGADVAVWDLEPELRQADAEVLSDRYGVVVQCERVDITDAEQIDRAALATQQAFGRVDILVQSAALVGSSALRGWTTPFAQQSIETWRKALDVNLTGAFMVAQALEPQLRSSGNGSVINIGSIYGLIGPDMRLYEGTEMGSPAAYAAAKGGLLQLTRWMATVLAPEIRVNAISPGGIWRDQPDSFASAYTARTPIGRMGMEEDIKGAIAYLAGDLSAYVTGQNIVVDGGITSW